MRDVCMCVVGSCRQIPPQYVTSSLNDPTPSYRLLQETKDVEGQLEV